MSKLSMSKIERHIFRLTNKERQKRGLKRLILSRPLGWVARKHSKDMSRRNYFSHVTRGTGETPTERGRRAGLKMGLGENIAQTWRHTYITITRNNTKHYQGFKDEKTIAASLVRMWMDSPGHRANMLSDSYNRIGVGVWVNYKNGKVHATQNFAYGQSRPRSFLKHLFRSIFLIGGIIITIIALSLSYW